MFLLSKNQILEYLDQKIFLINPLQTHLLNPNSYYFTLGRIIEIFAEEESETKTINLEDKGEAFIPPNGYLIGRSYETIDLSLKKKLFALLGSPPSLIQHGFLLCHSPSLDPYHTDQIQIGIKNLLPKDNIVRFKMAIGKATFFDISGSPISRDYLSESFKSALEKAVINPRSSEIEMTNL